MRGTGSEVSADDVVVQHAANSVALLLDPFEHVCGAEQTLLFAGDRGEKKRASEPAVRLRESAEQTGSFDTDCHAGSVVIGAGRVESGIHNVPETGHGVEVAGHEKDGFGAFFVGAR